jgi:hypothetical protein
LGELILTGYIHLLAIHFLTAALNQLVAYFWGRIKASKLSMAAGIKEVAGAYSPLGRFRYWSVYSGFYSYDGSGNEVAPSWHRDMGEDFHQLDKVS